MITLISAVIGLISAGVTYLDDKLKTKYIDEMIQIREDYRAEQNKPEPSDAVLCDLEFRLCNIIVGVTADLSLANAKNKPGQA